MAAPDDFNAEAIRAALLAAGLDRPIYYHEQTGSTNDDARRLAEAGAPSGALVVAASQTAGRGRGGRAWRSAPGASLALSVILRPEAVPANPPGGFTMLGGVAAAEAIEAVTGLPAELKWPNDVLLRRRKVCGVLAETAWIGDRLAYAVLGIGVNVRRGSEPAPEAALFPATSLEAEAGRTIRRLDVLVELVHRLEAWANPLSRPLSRATSLIAAWEARLAFQGEPVWVDTPQGRLEGLVAGVTPEGGLLLRLPDGATTRVMTGDVHLRPASGE